jgi:hypothetical protein
MPEIKVLTVKASGLKKDDRIKGASGVKMGKRIVNDGAYIRSCNPGHKNVTVETSLGRMIFAFDADVTVQREMPTEEEKAKQEAEYVRQTIARAITTWKSWGDVNPRQTARDAVEQYSPTRTGEALERTFANVCEQAVQLDVGNRVEIMRDENDMTDEEIFDAIVKQARTRLFAGIRNGVTSNHPVRAAREQTELKFWASLLDSAPVSYVLYSRGETTL